MNTPNTESQETLAPQDTLPTESPYVTDGPRGADDQRSVATRIRESVSVSNIAALPRKHLMFGLSIAAAVIAVPFALHRWRHAQHRRVLNAVFR